ncbi:MAG: enoyl-CoA hydratase/isomerase family protein, partial [Planctomycetota bacterium]
REARRRTRLRSQRVIRVEDNAAVRTITLDRPDKRNALTAQMLADLAAAFETEDSVCAVACIGSGKSFCSGFDLKSHPPTDDHTTLCAQLDGLSRAIVTMRACPAPIVMGVHGAAVAGGAALLGGADVVVCAPNAKIGYPVVRLGISPAVSAPFLTGAVGGRARGVTLDATLIDGVRAHELGLVHELADDPIARAVELARSIADKPGEGAVRTKRWMHDVEGLTDAAVRAGLDASLGSLGSDTVRRIQREVFQK